jgi:hypothetical protein
VGRRDIEDHALDAEVVAFAGADDEPMPTELDRAGVRVAGAVLDSEALHGTKGLDTDDDRRIEQKDRKRRKVKEGADTQM